MKSRKSNQPVSRQTLAATDEDSLEVKTSYYDKTSSIID